ncbi:hypothetical protein BDV96DRAFT_288454 [Lophiotrema nucula]|uniref:Uncharacterized protein n=1 Tax=Lophiotrema nucula TaxID=690887 RepID=A0A6A5YKS4_9PLEO|nr:hypothetical protein BDV96DRAFT_288454 [Lophiotrema nucula]
MSARRPLQPLSPLSANIVGAKYSYITKVDGGASHAGPLTMDQRVHDDNTQSTGSIVSGLTSLENDTNADDFERLMIQQARDERRLNDALRGSVQPFRKARTHPNVGLTLENLERNNASAESSAQVKLRSPPSVGSSRSSGSDPAIRVPAEWGRKGRVRRDWLRTITSDDEHKPGAQETSIVEDVTPRQSDQRAASADADRPLPSVEDSPLSRKSANGTPSSARRGLAHLDRMQDWDDTLDFNEASIIASTPYIPRNTVLDDIRQREIDSLKEQAVTTNRLDKIREISPEETRRPRSSSRHSVNGHGQTSGAAPDQAKQEPPSPGKLRKRTHSWKTIGKSQATTGEAIEQSTTSPFVVYKQSTESVGVVDSRFLASAQNTSQRAKHRREDSHDLLRRLARVSSGTPSPGRIASSRPQTASVGQPEDAVSRPDIYPSPAPTLDEPAQESMAGETVATAPETHPQEEQPPPVAQEEQLAPTSATQDSPAADIDATPMPVEPSILNAKTPKVTGAWVDTPGPRTISRPRSRSPIKPSPKKTPLEKQNNDQSEKILGPSIEPARPSLPRSALEAIVEEAKANGKNRQRDDDLGDSTIDSLEDLLVPGGEGTEIEQDEDTLFGLQLPTAPPKNEAERLRHQEVQHLHKMNQRLRSARTGIRDASRGLRRVEKEVENAEGNNEEGVRVVYRDCPCVVNGGHQCNPWTSTWSRFKGLFYDPTLTQRAGLTWLSIAIISSLVWLLAENVACDQYCHQLYAPSMKGFGVEWDAPQFPYVLPTMFYRKLLRPFWRPLWALLVWIWNATYNCFFEDDTVRETTTRTARHFASTAIRNHQTFEPDLRMSDDEFI